MKSARLKRGMIARYTGTDHVFMTGLKVKLIAPILDDHERPTGLWDVAPWIEKDQRFSWVTSDARREDLVPLDEENA
jgi:hypothetical protein